MPGPRGAAPAAPGARTGGWLTGDPVGDRQFVQLGSLALERGGSLPSVRVAITLSTIVSCARPTTAPRVPFSPGSTQLR